VNERKFLLLRKTRFDMALRVDEIDDFVDDDLDFGDHFASNPTKRGWTLAGVGDFFLKIFPMAFSRWISCYILPT
jgi:hypothetical protein